MSAVLLLCCVFASSCFLKARSVKNVISISICKKKEEKLVTNFIVTDLSKSFINCFKQQTKFFADNFMKYKITYLRIN